MSLEYENKMKSELFDELVELRNQIAEFKEAKIELKNVKQQLRQAKEELDLFYKLSLDVFMFVCFDGIINRMSPMLYKVLGYTGNEFIGKSLIGIAYKYLHPEDIKLTIATIKEVLAGKQLANLINRCRCKDGTYKWFEWTIRSFSKKDLMFAVARDVTEQKKAEEELKRSNQKLNNVLNSITDAFFTLDHEWRFTYVNLETERLWGVKKEKLIGKVIWSEFPKTISTPFYYKYHEAVKQQTSVSFGAFSPIINRWVEVHTYPSQDGLTVHFHDITEKRKSEEKLRLSEERFSKAFNFSPNPMCIRALKDWKYIDVNSSWLQCIGYSREEVIGRTAVELNLPANLKDGTNIKKIISERGSIQNAELEFYTKSGNMRTGLLSTEIINIEGEKCILGVMQDITERKLAEKALEFERQRLYSLLDGLPGLVCIIASDYTVRFANYNYRKNFGEPNNKYCYEIRYGRKKPCDGCYLKNVIRFQRPYYWESTNLNGEVRGIHEYPYYDIDGSPLVIKINFDITARKKTEQEMARLSRLNLVVEMAAGIAHEIRNPMTTVRGFLQMLGRKKECTKHKEYYEVMIEELDRANSIITEFLSLAKSKADNLKMQNLNTIVEAILPLITADALNSDKHVKVDLNNIPDLYLNNNEIRQLLLNLVRNGLEAMEFGGVLTIRTFTEGDEVIFAVRDQGKGIKPEILEKLGTPFFTTKDYGTGLGLATCYSIANRHNALIDVETGAFGTTFYIRFR